MQASTCTQSAAMEESCGDGGRYKDIGRHTFEEFIEMATLFHNYPAPGLLLGGYMVTEAMRHLPEDTLFEAISETAWCLPDAIQMLTPCTVGNGWMRVMNFGLYALSLYDKYTGKGVRVWLDLKKIPERSEIRTWYMKTKPKPEQDSERLRQEIGMAGATILSSREVVLHSRVRGKRSKGVIAVCPKCGEAYPARDGATCLSCAGGSPYMDGAAVPEKTVLFPLPEQVRSITAEDAPGRDVVHDMTRIDPGTSKGAAFRRGATFSAGDLCRLQHMGRNHVYVQDDAIDGNWVHEDECAKVFAEKMAGPGVGQGGDPHEGKISLVAQHNGLLRVDRDRLKAFNLCDGVMAASRCGWTRVRKGDELAATRAIPLFLQKDKLDTAVGMLEAGPLFEVLPMKKARTGILITGDEVYSGQIEDRFEDVVLSKLSELGCIHQRTIFVPDQRRAISGAARTLLDEGCELIITTAGLSVDPGDVTRHGLVDAGARDLVYGIPVLPGTMSLVGNIGKARLLGVPACALFYKRTALDLLLPRLLTAVEITAEDMAEMGDGGLCLQCGTCHFPACPFGK